jgi:hypothetical protein
MPSNPVNIILTGDLKCPDIRSLASKSVITISWSDIPSTLVDDLTKVGLVTNTRSKRFSSLVGWLCICVKLNASVMSTNPYIGPRNSNHRF